MRRARLLAPQIISSGIRALESVMQGKHALIISGLSAKERYKDAPFLRVRVGLNERSRTDETTGH